MRNSERILRGRCSNHAQPRHSLLRRGMIAMARTTVLAEGLSRLHNRPPRGLRKRVEEGFSLVEEPSLCLFRLFLQDV